MVECDCSEWSQNKTKNDINVFVWCPYCGRKLVDKEMIERRDYDNEV